MSFEVHYSAYYTYHEKKGSIIVVTQTAMALKILLVLKQNVSSCLHLQFPPIISSLMLVPSLLMFLHHPLQSSWILGSSNSIKVITVLC